MADSELSRRDFLKLGALGLVGLTFGPQIQVLDKVFKKTVKALNLRLSRE